MAAAPALYLRNPSGFTIAASGSLSAPSGLTLDALGGSKTTGQDIVNAGSIDGGAALTLYGANMKGGGAYKGNAMVISTFGSANNPVNGAHYLSNGLQLFPSNGSDVFLSLNDYGTAPQFFNLMVNGNAHVAMPSAWPSGGDAGRRTMHLFRRAACVRLEYPTRVMAPAASSCRRQER